MGSMVVCAMSIIFFCNDGNAGFAVNTYSNFSQNPNSSMEAMIFTSSIFSYVLYTGCTEVVCSDSMMEKHDEDEHVQICNDMQND